MSFAQRWHDIRTGFERPFWVANISELFERLSYYAVFASLARYLHEVLNFPTQQTGTLTGFFGGLVWFLPVFGGTLADKMGFRKALALAYLILSCAYFLLGSLGVGVAGARAQNRAAGVLVAFVLALPAFGVALVKPTVVGTTARASQGGCALVRLLHLLHAGEHRRRCWTVRGLLRPPAMSVENVFRVAALSVFVMFIGVLIFFKEPNRDRRSPDAVDGAGRQKLPDGAVEPALHAVPRDLHRLLDRVLAGVLTLPLYVHNYINPTIDTELLLMTGPLVVIALTVVITLLMQKMPR